MNEGFIVMYHGCLTAGRGIEVLLDLLALNPFVGGVILGNGDEKYVAKLKQKADELHVSRRVLFHEAVPFSQLRQYLGAADISLMMISGEVRSYYLSLPNKFFESIQALTPIVASDFPEMRRIIQEYGIGLTCDPTDIASINACVERFRTDRAFYQECKDNLWKAKEELCWENEKKALMKAWERYL